MEPPVKVYWITGLSGAGKTTIGKMLSSHLKRRVSNVVYLDGDVLRSVYDGMHGYTSNERRTLAMHYARLCKILADQRIIVVCATISMFKEVQDWNRNNILGYTEIYLKVPLDVLIERDQKGIYSRALNKEITHVMGIDIPLEEPENPDITLINDGSCSPETVLQDLVSVLDL